MAYNPVTDFPAMLRKTSGGVRFTELPGLDFVVAALARAGFINLVVSATAPTTNQAATVWYQPSSPSWVAEGIVWLWNPAIGAYAPATPALWSVLLTPAGYLFASASNANNVVSAGTTIVAVQRVAPAATSIMLPSVAAQWLTGRKLKIVDWSTGVANHDITLMPVGTDTIMQQSNWQLLSNAVQLAGIELTPVPDLDGWIIAP